MVLSSISNGALAKRVQPRCTASSGTTTCTTSTETWTYQPNSTHGPPKFHNPILSTRPPISYWPPTHWQPHGNRLNIPPSQWRSKKTNGQKSSRHQKPRQPNDKFLPSLKPLNKIPTQTLPQDSISQKTTSHGPACNQLPRTKMKNRGIADANTTTTAANNEFSIWLNNHTTTVNPPAWAAQSKATEQNPNTNPQRNTGIPPVLSAAHKNSSHSTYTHPNKKINDGTHRITMKGKLEKHYLIRLKENKIKFLHEIHQLITHAVFEDEDGLLFPWRKAKTHNTQCQHEQLQWLYEWGNSFRILGLATWCTRMLTPNFIVILRVKVSNMLGHRQKHH